MQLRYLSSVQDAIQWIRGLRVSGRCLRRITVELISNTKWPEDWCDEAVRCGGLFVYYWVWYLDIIDALLEDENSYAEKVELIAGPRSTKNAGVSGLRDEGWVRLLYRNSDVDVDMRWSFDAKSSGEAERTRITLAADCEDEKVIDLADAFVPALDLSITEFITAMGSGGDRDQISRVERVHRTAFLCSAVVENV